jgi:hypothetical protein
VLHPGNREEKDPCSASTSGGVGAASSVPKSNGTKLGKAREPEEENPAPRTIKTEKKEEKLSANPSKKIHRKKIHSQPPVLHLFDFTLGNSIPRDAFKVRAFARDGELGTFYKTKAPRQI